MGRKGKRTERGGLPAGMPREFAECMTWAAELGLNPLELLDGVLRSAAGDLARLLELFKEERDAGRWRPGNRVGFHLRFQARGCGWPKGHEVCELCGEGPEGHRG